VANENRFRKWSLEVRKKHALLRFLGFFGINNGMEFMFSIFWTFKKVLIDVIFASIHTSFVLLQL
jgi:hypothetical protein